MKINRLMNSFAALFCFGVVLFGFYLEQRLSLEPCILCELQRGIFILLGVISLIAMFKHYWVYKVLGIIFSTVGALLALRQITLQALPPSTIETCLPSLGALIKLMPLTQAFNLILESAGHCSKITWSFAGLSLAHWSLFGFLLVGVLMVVQILIRR